MHKLHTVQVRHTVFASIIAIRTSIETICLHTFSMENNVKRKRWVFFFLKNVEMYYICGTRAI